jgi:hypothetical protein
MATTTIKAGNTKDLVFTVSGTDLSTATAITFKVATAFGTSSALSKSLSSGIVADSSTQCTVSLTATDTGTTLSAATYVYELTVTDASGNIDTTTSDNDRLVIAPSIS